MKFAINAYACNVVKNNKTWYLFLYKIVSLYVTSGWNFCLKKMVWVSVNPEAETSANKCIGFYSDKKTIDYVNIETSHPIPQFISRNQMSIFIAREDGKIDRNNFICISTVVDKCIKCWSKYIIYPILPKILIRTLVHTSALQTGRKEAWIGLMSLNGQS